MKYREFWISEAMGQGESDHVHFGDKPPYWPVKLNVNQFHAIEHQAYTDQQELIKDLVDMLERMGDLFHRDNGREFEPLNELITKAKGMIDEV